MKLLRFTNSTLPTIRSGKYTLVLSLCILSNLCVSAVAVCQAQYTKTTQNRLFVSGIVDAAPVQQSAPNIGVNGSLSANKVKRGRTIQATVVMDIPSGYHVNSSRPLERFLIPTQLKVEAPKGLRVGAVSYPHAVLRKFQFSKNQVSVYEGRATMRFSISVPPGAPTGSQEVKARLRYQSCNDEACFPPQNKDVSLWLNVE
jgi:DsbC/DsbD-like thiol-disulfide interchange protein